MVRKLHTGSRTSQKRSLKPTPSPIPEPLQIVAASTVMAGVATIKVPTLVLRGEWLKAIGFPIGSALYLTTDERGEITLHRLGLGLPRRLRIVASSQ